MSNDVPLRVRVRGLRFAIFLLIGSGHGSQTARLSMRNDVEGRLVLLAPRLLGREGGVAVISEFLLSFRIVVALQQRVEVAPLLVMGKNVVPGRRPLADALPARHRPFPFYGPEGGAPGRLRRQRRRRVEEAHGCSGVAAWGACCVWSEAALDELQALQALDEWLVAGLRRAGVPAPRCLVLLASAAPGEMAALDDATPYPLG